MKKQIKIAIIALIVIVTFNMLAGTVFADELGLIKSVGKGGTSVETTEVQNFGKAIVSVTRVLGVVVAVVVLLILGIKYMIGTTQERADYKKTMVPYIIGAIIIFASTTIVGVIYDLTTSLNNEGGSSAGTYVPYYDTQHGSGYSNGARVPGAGDRFDT